MNTDQEKEKFESRTEMMLDGSMVESVNIGPTGIRVYRKGGGIIDVTPSRRDDNKRAPFNIDFISKAV